jgi:hypothetical protein
MKTLAIVAALLLACACAVAQVPHVLSYQGVLRDASGTPVADGSYEVTFRIYESLAAPSALWTETQTLTASEGIISAELGSVVTLNLSFDQGYWLGVSVESESELSPRVYLTAAPYAIRAAVADTVEGLGELSLPYEDSGTLGYNPLFKITNDSSTGSAVYGRNSATDRFGYLGGEYYGAYGERYQEYGATSGHLGGGSYGAYGKLDAGFGVYHSGYLGGTGYGAYGESDAGPMGGTSEGGLGGQYGVYGHVDPYIGGVKWGYIAGSTYAVYGNGGSGYAAGFDGDVVVNGTATIDDVLKLEPRIGFPSSPTDGMVCVQGIAPDYHMYVYLNDAWRQLDPTE